ncbi:hypothetical protein PMZ80_008156 [Knufia obscura]|uniref:Uncharacterized protein n=1 Tax=Knufia obscura TaxID=1635080 RepID=A0ABR0RI38_9EURO|nr:hypothetical protein PMZ80_008156 [Knufia obscura]
MATPTNLEALRSDTPSLDTESAPSESRIKLLDLPPEIVNAIARHVLLDEQDVLPYRATKLDTSMNGICKQLQRNHEYAVFNQLPWALVFLNESLLLNQIVPVGGIPCSYSRLSPRVRPALLLHIYQTALPDRARCKRLILLPLVSNHLSNLLGEASIRLYRLRAHLHDNDRHISLHKDILELVKRQTHLSCLFQVSGDIPGIVNARHNNTISWESRGREEVLQHIRGLISFVSKYNINQRTHGKHTTLLTANLAGLQAAYGMCEIIEDGTHLTRQYRSLRIHILLTRLQCLNGFILGPHSPAVRIEIRTWPHRLTWYFRDSICHDSIMTDQERFIYHVLAAEFWLSIYLNDQQLANQDDSAELRTQTSMSYLWHAELQLFYALQLRQTAHTITLMRYVMSKLSRNVSNQREVDVFLTTDETGTHTWCGDPDMITHWRQVRHPYYTEVAGPNDNTDGFRRKWPKHTQRDERDTEALESAFECRMDILQSIARLDRKGSKDAALLQMDALSNIETVNQSMKDAYVVSHVVEKAPELVPDIATDTALTSGLVEKEFDILENNFLLRTAASRGDEAEARARGLGRDADRDAYLFWLVFLYV